MFGTLEEKRTLQTLEAALELKEQVHLQLSTLLSIFIDIVFVTSTHPSTWKIRDIYRKHINLHQQLTTNYKKTYYLTKIQVCNTIEIYYQFHEYLISQVFNYNLITKPLLAFLLIFYNTINLHLLFLVMVHLDPYILFLSI